MAEEIRLVADRDRAEVLDRLKQLQADRSRSAVLSGYVAVLTDDAGWGVETVAAMLGVSRQSISNRRRQGRQLRMELADELAALPAPAAPASGNSAGRTRSGLRVPDAEEITAAQQAWVREEFGQIPSERGQLPERLRLVAGLLDDCDSMIDSLRGQRAEIAWSLTCFDAAARQGLQRAGHWQPDEFFAARTEALAPAAEVRRMDAAALRDLAAARGIPEITDLDRARDEYHTVTSRLIAAQARRRSAVGVRDDLIRRYVHRDATGRWSGVSAVASWIGRAQAQVTQICDRG